VYIDKLAEKKQAVYEDEDGQTFTYLEVLAEVIATNIYDGITNPYSQLLLIEHTIEVWEVSYASFSRALKKEAEKHTKCIACKKQVAKPCFTINVKDISYLRKRKNQMGTAKGNLHLNKHSPKMKQVEAIINSFDEYKLNSTLTDNIRNNLKDLRPELLTLLTGKVSIKADTTETPLQITLLIGLLPLIPDREKDFFFDSKIPKYGKEIDVKEYLTFWNYASQLNHLGVMKHEYYGEGEGQGEGYDADVRFHIENMLGFTIPFPCEKDTDYWKGIERDKYHWDELHKNK
jgi:hypothetical protein